MIRKLFITAVAVASVMFSSLTAWAQNEIPKGDINLIVASDLGRNGRPQWEMLLNR